jgi:lipid II:glycine glycyltransferase (peptidoglycan interpeptide bridge formation enzyme)
MGGYALQWTAMKIAKEQGCHIYDFYGYDRFRSSDHPYARFSQFKSQFGGTPMRFIGAQDYFFMDNLADSIISLAKQLATRC